MVRLDRQMFTCVIIGFGKFNGREGLRAFCKQKSFVTDRFPGMSNAVPGFLQYPIKKHSHQAAAQLFEILYAPNLIQKIKACFNIVKILLTKKD